MRQADYPDAKYIQASHFMAGRAGSPVEIIVVHTTENPCEPGVARKVAFYFNAPQTTTSAHYIIGPDEVVQCVQEEDTAWHAQGANHQSIGLEHTGRALFTEDQWGSPGAQEMLRKSAHLAAHLCQRHGIPAQYVDRKGLEEHQKGITTHAEVSAAFRKSDHSDPGEHFPMEAWLAMIEEAMTCA